jgi:hypothetical protein
MDLEEAVTVTTSFQPGSCGWCVCRFYMHEHRAGLDSCKRILCCALFMDFPDLNMYAHVCFQKNTHTESGGRGAMRAEKESMMRVVTPS